MQSLILVIEHRQCQCGMEYTAPSPRQLTSHELTNFHSARIYLPQGSPRREVIRETIHVNTSIEACPKCFHSYNGVQFELFPEEEPKPLVFINGNIREKEPPKPNPYGLSYF